MSRGVAAAGVWQVYMVACADGTLYTGITTDLARRLDEHNRGKGGARYTRGRRPVRLVYRETASGRAEAARREYQIKQLPPAAKLALIRAVTGATEPSTSTGNSHVTTL